MEKVSVHLLHPCYDCYDFFCSPQSVIKHIKARHGVEISGRQPGKSRPLSKSYYYEKSPYDGSVIHYACPSCWFHCSESAEDAFTRHVIENHVCPTNNLIFEEVIEENQTSIDENDGLESIKRAKSKEKTFAAQNEAKAKQEAILDVLNGLIINFKNLMSNGSQ
jgi:hypothetical protein